jgi:hypothetical protein
MDLKCDLLLWRKMKVRRVCKQSAEENACMGEGRSEELIILCIVNLCK